MNKEELTRILIDIRTLSQKMEAKEERIDTLLQYAETVLAECNDFFKRAADFLNAPADGSVSPPIPAWKHYTTADQAAQAVQQLKQLMDDGAPVLTEIMEYRNRYNSFNASFADCMKNITNTFRDSGIAIEHAAALKVAEPLQQLDRQLDVLVQAAPGYEVRLKKMKSELNAIKEVN